MVAVRNSAVAQGSVSAGTALTVYVVPANHVFILKSLILFGTAGTGNSYVVFLGTQAGPFVRLTEGDFSSSAIATWSSWTALNATDRIDVRADGQGLQYWVAGAVLPSVL